MTWTPAAPSVSTWTTTGFSSYRITEPGAHRITEDGRLRIPEGSSIGWSSSTPPETTWTTEIT